MTTSKRELVLTGPAPYPGGIRPRLRIMKSSDRPDGNSYLVPLPGIAPPGFHLSRHPRGDVHWKAETGTISRGDASRFSDALKDGTLDRVISSLIVRPQRQRSPSAVIIPRTLTETFSLTHGDVNLRIDDFIESLQPVALGDTRHLPQSFHVLRRAGMMELLDVILISDYRRDGSLAFFNLTGLEPIRIPPLEITREMPLWRSASVAISHFREYGGVFVLFPEGKRFERTAKKIGLGWIADGMAYLNEVFEESPPSLSLESRVRSLEAGFVPSLCGLTPKRCVRIGDLRDRMAMSRRIATRPN